LLEIVFGFFVFSKRSFAGYVIQNQLERFFILIVFSKRSFTGYAIQKQLERFFIFNRLAQSQDYQHGNLYIYIHH
jgi:hypothetical protein